MFSFVPQARSQSYSRQWQGFPLSSHQAQACFRPPQWTTLLPSLCPDLRATARYPASLGSLLVSWQKTDLSKCKSDWATCCSQNPLFSHQDPKAECPLQRPSAINCPLCLTSLACRSPETPLFLQGLIPSHLPEAAKPRSCTAEHTPEQL